MNQLEGMSTGIDNRGISPGAASRGRTRAGRWILEEWESRDYDVKKLGCDPRRAADSFSSHLILKVKDTHTLLQIWVD